MAKLILIITLSALILSASANETLQSYKGSFTVRDDGTIVCWLEEADQIALYKRLNIPEGETIHGPQFRLPGVKKIYLNSMDWGQAFNVKPMGLNTIELLTENETLTFNLLWPDTSTRNLSNVCLLDINEIREFLKGANN